GGWAGCALIRKAGYQRVVTIIGAIAHHSVISKALFARAQVIKLSFIDYFDKIENSMAVWNFVRSSDVSGLVPLLLMSLTSRWVADQRGRSTSERNSL
ncbi:MAG: hypothetical protein ABIO39_01140, partial [Caulobacteraceae bacterium]